MYSWTNKFPVVDVHEESEFSDRVLEDFQAHKPDKYFATCRKLHEKFQVKKDLNRYGDCNYLFTENDGSFKELANVRMNRGKKKSYEEIPKLKDNTIILSFENITLFAKEAMKIIHTTVMTYLDIPESKLGRNFTLDRKGTGILAIKKAKRIHIAETESTNNRDISNNTIDDDSTINYVYSTTIALKNDAISNEKNNGMQLNTEPKFKTIEFEAVSHDFDNSQDLLPDYELIGDE